MSKRSRTKLVMNLMGCSNRDLQTMTWNMPDEPAPFKGNDQVLEAALTVFRARAALKDKANAYRDEDLEAARVLGKVVPALTRSWHACMALTPRSVSLADTVRRLRLNRIETEILMVLLLDPLGLTEQRITDTGDVLNALCLPPSKSLSALRALSDEGKLHRKGILFYDDPDEDLRDRDLCLDPGLVESVLQDKKSRNGFSGVNTEEELHEVLCRLTRALHKKSDELSNFQRGYSNQADFQKWSRKADWLLSQLNNTLDANSSWKLALARKQASLNYPEWCVVLALLGKALNHMSAEDEFFTGAGLCRAICDRPEQFNHRIGMFMTGAPLLKGDFIQPCGGIGSLMSESAESVQEMEFELTPRMLTVLGLDKTSDLRAKRDEALRQPRISLKDLALTEPTREAVAMALDHVRHAHTLMETWGLGKQFPYGNGVTLLFWGPPGTGKSATAEAIAHALERPLLVADYSKIQNCFVGQTEKNIAATFRKARQHNAVLFWDEADAMFFDRDAASRTWEVRDVNVLLQEIERFEGVCILATNRKATLDKALERRITAKVEFPRPGQSLRETLWRKLLPRELPLAKDVDIAQLAEADLAGGEIKNVILNAARRACARPNSPKVTNEDLHQALDMETKGRWSKSGGGKRIGFGR